MTSITAIDRDLKCNSSFTLLGVLTYLQLPRFSQLVLCSRVQRKSLKKRKRRRRRTAPQRTKTSRRDPRKNRKNTKSPNPRLSNFMMNLTRSFQNHLRRLETVNKMRKSFVPLPSRVRRSGQHSPAPALQGRVTN